MILWKIKEIREKEHSFGKYDTNFFRRKYIVYRGTSVFVSKVIEKLIIKFTFDTYWYLISNKPSSRNECRANTLLILNEMNCRRYLTIMMLHFKDTRYHKLYIYIYKKNERIYFVCTLTSQLATFFLLFSMLRFVWHLMKLFAYPSECSWQLLINAGLLFSGGREEEFRD